MGGAQVPLYRISVIVRTVTWLLLIYCQRLLSTAHSFCISSFRTLQQASWAALPLLHTVHPHATILISRFLASLHMLFTTLAFLIGTLCTQCHILHSPWFVSFSKPVCLPTSPSPPIPHSGTCWFLDKLWGSSWPYNPLGYNHTFLNSVNPAFENRLTSKCAPL